MSVIIELGVEDLLTGPVHAGFLTLGLDYFNNVSRIGRAFV